MTLLRRLITSGMMAALFGAGVFSCAWATEITPPAKINQDQYLRGSFTMERYLAGFDKPLRSNGDFILSPTTGLVWRTLDPFPGTTVLDDHGITRIDDQGNRDALARGDQFRQFVELISAVLAGNWQPLEQRFDITKSTTADNAWQIILTPKDNTAIASQITKITATGNDYVQTIQLEKPSDDHDDIILADQGLGNLPLPPEFAALLTGTVK